MESRTEIDIPLMEAVAEAAARKVGAEINKALRGEIDFATREKGLRDLVTEIDLWSEREIQSAVEANFPQHLVLGEETGAAAGERHGRPWPELAAQNICWVVDPLDGTTNFVNRIPHVCVSIGVLDRGKKVLGLVYDPSRDELFTARRGSGAFLNGRRIAPGSKKKLIEAVVCTGLPSPGNWPCFRRVSEAVILNCHKLRIFGSAALDLCWTACGRLDGFFEYSLRPWDTAAGSLIAEEAGARVQCFINPQPDEFSIFAPSVLTCGPSLFPQLQELVHSHHWKE